MLLAVLSASAAAQLKSDIVHDAGLRPHHNTGAAAEDPLLFRHRFQHHDANTGRLLYYQYEARRSSRVTMVEEMGAISCAASDRGNSTSVDLAVADAAAIRGIAVGDIIAGTGPSCMYADGSPWRQDGSLRERVLNVEVHVSFSEAILRVDTVPAGLHECFDDSQFEFFHGSTANFEQARLAHLASAGETENGTFASTKEVLDDADRALGAEEQTVSQRRQLHDKCPWDWTHYSWFHSDTYSYDIAVSVVGGTDCNVQGDDTLINEVEQMTSRQCYWSEGSKDR